MLRILSSYSRDKTEATGESAEASPMGGHLQEWGLTLADISGSVTAPRRWRKLRSPRGTGLQRQYVLAPKASAHQNVT